MSRRAYLWLGIFAGLLAIFLILPGLAVIPMSFNGARTMRFPPESWGLSWYENFFTGRVWVRSLSSSLLVATLSAVLATIVGTCAAFALVRYKFRGKSILA